MSPNDLETDRGRAQRFDELYRNHYSAVYAFARRRMAPVASEVEDVVANVFAVVWRRIEQVPVAPQDRLWIYGVARRCVQSAQRSQRRRARLQVRLSHEAQIRDREISPGAEPSNEAVRAAIAGLRPRDREVLMLVMWEQLTHQQAAQVLGCSANAVAIRLHRARTRVRKQLDAPGEPTGAVNTAREAHSQ
jgi:RNA polymerase sigma-70 factor (ECF subfamily)